MSNSKNVICIGELLIDFICSDVDVTLDEGTNFIKKAGGAPANVCASISKLGGESLFAGKVGDDPFGLFLRDTLIDAGVDTSMLVFDKSYSTTLAFVSLKENGERDFVFNRGADEELSYDEIDINLVDDAKIIHFGSATGLLGGLLRDTYLKVMKYAYDKGVFISFDPNYREDLWKRREKDFIKESRKCLEYSHFVKVSEDELKLLSGEDDLEEGVKKFHSLGAKTVAVTLGSKGTLISNGKKLEKIESVNVKSIDSTGAGDAFVGGFLYRISEIENNKDILDDFEIIKDITRFSNRVGAIVCTKLGAISSLPTLEEVKNFK